MHKILASLLVVAFVFSLVSVGIASAEENTEATNPAGRGEQMRGWLQEKFDQAKRPELSEEEIAARKQRRLEHGAEMLGISQDALRAKLESGMKMPEIAKEQGISPEEFGQKIQKQARQRMEEHVRQMVKEGKITQQQAVQKMEQAQKRIQKMKNKRHINGSGSFNECPNQKPANN